MKVLLVVVVALLAAANAAKPLRIIPVEETTGYDYHNRFGIPLAKAIREDEEKMLADPSRIVGGSLAGTGAHPHQGGLVITMATGGQSVCGCCLISSNRCLTAAHCWSSQARSLTVVLGSLMLFSGGTRVTATSVQNHASYNPSNLNNDISMIIMPAVNMHNNIQPVARATGTATHAGSTATASGWGRTTNNGGVATNKHHVQLPIITNAVCQQTFGGTIIASTICTSGAGGRGPCNGDSGGPLVVGTGNNRMLVGVTSFVAAAGCSNGFPAGFARVSSFTTWINQRM